MALATNPCKQCGQKFQYTSRKNQAFCSKTCQYAHMRRETSSATDFKGHKPRTGEFMPCAHCGKDFYRRKNEALKGRRFCSQPCKAAGTITQVTNTCEKCGVEFQVFKSLAHQRFCSRICEKSTRIARPLDREHNGRPARINNYGYVMLWEPEHPGAFHGWFPEHRLVVEQRIGRHLLTDEHVHHINGVKDDNRPENLQVLGHSEHSVITAKELWEGIEQDRAELARYRALYGPLPQEEAM